MRIDVRVSLLELDQFRLRCSAVTLTHECKRCATRNFYCHRLRCAGGDRPWSVQADLSAHSQTPLYLTPFISSFITPYLVTIYSGNDIKAPYQKTNQFLIGLPPETSHHKSLRAAIFKRKNSKPRLGQDIELNHHLQMRLHGSVFLCQDLAKTCPNITCHQN